MDLKEIQGAASQTAKLLDACVFVSSTRVCFPIDQLIMVALIVTKIELPMCSAELYSNGPSTPQNRGDNRHSSSHSQSNTCYAFIHGHCEHDGGLGRRLN